MLWVLHLRNKASLGKGEFYRKQETLAVPLLHCSWAIVLLDSENSSVLAVRGLLDS